MTVTSLSNHRCQAVLKFSTPPYSGPISPIYGRWTPRALVHVSWGFIPAESRLILWIWGTETYWHRMGHITQSRRATFGPPHCPGHPRLSISCREVRNLARWRRPRLSRASAEVAAGKLAMNVSSKRWATKNIPQFYAFLPNRPSCVLSTLVLISPTLHS
jgi:hypothetical protein